MKLSYTCKRCGWTYAIRDDLVGKRVRCKQCGLVGRVPGDEKIEPEFAPSRLAKKDKVAPLSRGIRAPSLLPVGSLCLLGLSLADLFVTHRLLQGNPRAYEANPVARWFFERWNIAGMAIFKLSVMAGVISIAEFVEHRRPGYGRFVLLVGCLATAYVVWRGMQLMNGPVEMIDGGD